MMCVSRISLALVGTAGERIKTGGSLSCSAFSDRSMLQIALEDFGRCEKDVT